MSFKDNRSYHNSSTHGSLRTFSYSKGKNDKNALFYTKYIHSDFKKDSKNLKKPKTQEGLCRKSLNKNFNDFPLFNI